VNNIKLVITVNPDSNLMDIRVLLNGMMDGFVNYNLIEFEEFYKLIFKSSIKSYISVIISPKLHFKLILDLVNLSII